MIQHSSTSLDIPAQQKLLKKGSHTDTWPHLSGNPVLHYAKRQRHCPRQRQDVLILYEEYGLSSDFVLGLSPVDGELQGVD